MKITLAIWLIGVLFTALLYVVFQDGMAIFGVSATLGSFWLKRIIETDGKGIKGFIREEEITLILLALGTVGLGVFFALPGLDAFIAYLVMLPTYATLGVAWVVFVNRLMKRLLKNLFW